MDSSQTRRVIAAGLIGNVLEWYDFAIYGYFATAIGRHFFPHEDAAAQLLSAFGVFALGARALIARAACGFCYFLSNSPAGITRALARTRSISSFVMVPSSRDDLLTLT